MSRLEGEMTVGVLCVREVVLADPEETVGQAARRMRDRRVGSLVVVDEDRRPLGLLTDRDLVVRAVATTADPGGLLVRDVMSAPADTVWEDTTLEEALAHMRLTKHRRMVVVDADGGLVGILALDDVLGLFAHNLRFVGELVSPG